MTLSTPSSNPKHNNNIHYYVYRRQYGHPVCIGYYTYFVFVGIRNTLQRPKKGNNLTNSSPRALLKLPVGVPEAYRYTFEVSKRWYTRSADTGGVNTFVHTMTIIEAPGRALIVASTCV